MAKRGKITIKHYLNTKLKGYDPFYEGNENILYPIYVQISVKRKVGRLKSLYYYFDKETKDLNYFYDFPETQRLSKKDFIKYSSDPNSEIYKKLNAEKEFLLKLINYLKPFENPRFSLNRFSFEFISMATLFVTQASSFLNIKLTNELVSMGITYAGVLININAPLDKVLKAFKDIIKHLKREDSDLMKKINDINKAYKIVFDYDNEIYPNRKIMKLDWIVDGHKDKLRKYARKTPNTSEECIHIIDELTTAIFLN